MGAIFLSYAREDRAFAETLARVLGQAGHDVWWDRHIDGGEEFASEIEAALDKAEAVLVAWSEHSIKSRWVRDEASVGGDTGRLVPVTVDGSRPPMGFRQFHTLDLAGWKGARSDKRTGELLRSVERRLKAGNAIGALAPQPPVSVSRPRLGARQLALAATFAAVTLVSGYYYLTRQHSGPQPAVTVAVLPFTADASDAEARKLAAASRDAVAHTLSQSAFAVRTINAVPQGDSAPAEFLISGQVTSTPDKIVANVRMEETDHHLVVFSHQFEVSAEKAWELPERVGAQVASQLSWTAPIIAMERRHPSDPAVVRLLLQSSTAGLNGSDLLQDFERARELAAKAPDSPLAQDNLAFSTAFALSQIPRGDRATVLAAARRANDRTLKLAPEYNGGHIAWCLLHSDVRLLDCESSLRAGMKADPDGPFANFFLGQLYNGVGRNREGADLASLSLAHDQYMPFKIGLMLRMLEITGETERSEQLYRRSALWWPANDSIIYNRLTGMVQRGDFKAAHRFDEETSKQGNRDPVLAAIAEEPTNRIQQLCAPAMAHGQTGIFCMLGLARIGRLDSALAVADRLYPSRVGLTEAEEDRIWLDDPDTNPPSFLASAAAAPLRRHPKFLSIAARVGLLQYWRTGRLPDFCKATAEPICSSIRKRH